MAKSAGRLSLFAGAGALVSHVVDAAIKAGYKVQVLALTPRDDVLPAKVVSADLGNPMGIIWSLNMFRTTHIAMAGGIHLSDRTREGLIRFANGNAPANDVMTETPVGDAALAALGKVLKKMTGADLVGVHELSPDLLSPSGHIAGPMLELEGSAQFALETAKAIGALDIGQAAVVSGRRVIAVEDIGGTDALIARVAALRAEGLVGDGIAPLILAKAMKPQQPGFVDLPAIGPRTVERCAEAGIAAIVVEAGRGLLLQRDELVEAASRHGIAVLGLSLGNG
jgi:DUF1009 family protein